MRAGLHTIYINHSKYSSSKPFNLYPARGSFSNHIHQTKTKIMKQKVVVRVSMNGEKSRSKALKTTVGLAGVESAAIKGKEKDEIEVIGDEMDVVELAKLLRKNVGYTDVVSVGPPGGGGDKKEGDKKEAQMIYYPSYPPPIFEVRGAGYDPSCTIL